MKKILISIKPYYAKNIFDGIKKYEYRTKLPKEKITKLIIYCTSPIKKIIGEAEIEEILSLDPSLLWEKTKDLSGIKKIYFENYFKDKKIGFAYKLGNVVQYKKPKTLNDFGFKYPPQSFCYVD